MINIWLFNFINGFAGKYPFLDNLMIFSAKFLIFLIPLFLIYMFFQNKKKSLFCFLSILLGLALSNLIGSFVYVSRPFVVGLGTQLVEHVADASFPSDHSIIFFALGFSLLFVNYKKEGIIFLLLGALVGFSRIFTGLHFPLDILGSLMISFIVVFLFYFIAKKYFKLKNL